MPSLTDYQKQIDDFLENENYDPKYWSPTEITTNLVEELGEIARLINRLHGPKTPKAGDTDAELEHELGDLLFAVATLANSLDMNLDNAIIYAINKAQTRDLDRFPRKTD
jgi:NTP pyrophosphatase (non-canonical NTP hydrolase)